MGMNVSTSMGFESNEFLKSAAKEVLKNCGVESEKAAEIAQRAIFESREANVKNQYSVLSTSTQITVNNTLKETLRYLKSHANENKRKKYIFGEIWNVFEANNDASEENPYRGELYDFEIDKKVKNIFAA